MYAAIRIYDEAEGLADGATEDQERILGMFREIAGFGSYYAVRTGPTSVATITICDDQAAAEASVQAARDYIAANWAHLSVSAPKVYVGEVAMNG